MWEQSVLLEYGIHRTHVRRSLRYFLARNTDFTFRCGLKSRNQTQKCGLTTTRRTKYRNELAFLHIQIDVIQCDFFAKKLGNTLNFNDIITLLHIILNVERKDRKIIIIFAQNYLKLQLI